MIVLKNLKSSEALSQETLAFTATLYWHGKRIGTAMNEGHGGPCMVHFDGGWNDKLHGELCHWAKVQLENDPDRDQEIKLDLYAEHPGLALDTYIAELAEKEVHTRWLKRQCRTKILGIMSDNKEGEYSTWKCKYTPEVAKKLRDRHGADLIEIVNERFL